MQSPTFSQYLISGLLVIFLLFGIFVVTSIREDVKVAYLSKDDFYHPNESYFEYYTQPVPNNIINKTPPDWLSYRPVYTINSDGLNERRDYSPRVPEKTFRIITLGDSWTFGQFVNTEENFSEQLEDILNSHLSCADWDHFEVINLGSPSYDVQYSVERFRLKGEKYNPSLLIWLLIENDFDEVSEDISRYMKNIFPDGNIPEVNRMNQDEAYLEHKKALVLLKSLYTTNELIEFQKNALEKIRAYHNRNILFYTLSKGSGIDVEFKPILERATSEDPNIEWFESSIQLSKNNLSLPDQHPSSDGHRAIAENLFHYISAKYLQECSLSIEST
jgi:hypothetical protein